jgi:hypothetical protein
VMLQHWPSSHAMFTLNPAGTLGVAFVEGSVSALNAKVGDTI